MSNNDQLPSNFEYFLPTKLFAQAWFHLLKAKLYKSISITNFFSLYQKLRDMPIYPTQIENVRGIFEKKVFFGKSFFLSSRVHSSLFYCFCFSHFWNLFFKSCSFVLQTLSLICLSVFLFVCLSVHPPILQSLLPFISLFVCIYICLSICPSIHPFNNPPVLHFIQSPVCLFICLSACLSVCLNIIHTGKHLDSMMN